MLRTVQIEVEVTGMPSMSCACCTAGIDCIWTLADKTTTSTLAVFRRLTSSRSCMGSRRPTSRLSGISKQMRSWTSMPSLSM